MKIKLFILAALALVAASCAKTEMNVPEASNAAVPVKLTLSMPDAPQTRMGFEKTDPAQPLSLKALWKADFPMLLILFQSDREDNADWKDHCVVHEFNIPASAEGQTTVDLSAAVGTVDLSALDANKPLKYVVTTGYKWFDPYKCNRLGNGYSQFSAKDLSGQLIAMIFATPVQQTPFPSGGSALALSGKLEWLTAALAVQFHITPAAEALQLRGSQGALFVALSGNGYAYPDMYDLVLRKRRSGEYSYGTGIYYSRFETLGSMLDSDGYRYFTIPADDTEGIKISGSKIRIQAKYEAGNVNTGETLGTLNPDIAIEPGKCYRIKIKVDDANGDGIPEFTRE